MILTRLFKSAFTNSSARASAAAPDLQIQAQLANLELRARQSWDDGRAADAVALAVQLLATQADNLLAHMLLAAASLPGEGYIQLLGRIHQTYRPRTYLEIGVAAGNSIVLVQPGTLAIGIDPAPAISHVLPASTRIFAQTSDAFFAEHDVRAEFGGAGVELAFIDGLHRFESALRDFINVERYCTPASTVLVHDCFPLDAATAARERGTTFWSGDVWKLIVCLKQYRSDLSVHTVAAAPTGLGVIRNLDPSSTILSDHWEQILADFVGLPYSSLGPGKAQALNLVPNEWGHLVALLGSAPGSTAG
jgi:hypothetical protein